MADPLRLLCALAHPDDESLGCGGVIARYAAEGVETYLVTATRGQRGWNGEDYPGPEALGRMREEELRQAASVLGLREVNLLDYMDGDLDQADPAEATRQLVSHIRRIRPHVAISFGPDGAYGHPDHIAICQFTTAALVAAADSAYQAEDDHAPHAVAKLYYFAPTVAQLAVYQSAFGDLVMRIDGVERRGAGWRDWNISARIETAQYWKQVWEAVSCHRTQLPGYAVLENLPEEQHRALWGEACFYRALSLVNGGRAVEDDLFAGLREASTS